MNMKKRWEREKVGGEKEQKHCCTSPQAVHFATYEAAMLWLNPEKSYNPYHHALAGAVAGGAAATAALPLDACKTLLNTQEVQMQYWTQLDFPSLGECAQTAQCSKRDRSSRCSNNNIQDGWLLGLLSGSEGQNLLCDAWYCYFLVGTQIID